MTDDAKIDRWNDGAIDGCRGRKPASADADYMDGYRHGCEAAKVRVILPARPEGYYHAASGTFEE